MSMRNRVDLLAQFQCRRSGGSNDDSLTGGAGLDSLNGGLDFDIAFDEGELLNVNIESIPQLLINHDQLDFSGETKKRK